MSLQNIYARIAPSYYQKLSAVAEMRNQSVSQLIRSIVVAFLESTEEAVDVAIDDNSNIQAEQRVHQFVEDTYTHVNTKALPLTENISDELELDW